MIPRATLRVGCDVDGVVLDYAVAVYNHALMILNRPLPYPDEWQHYRIKDALGMSDAEESRFWQSLPDDFHLYVPWYKGALDFLTRLTSDYDVVFVTGGSSWPGRWVEMRAKLFKDLFPSSPIIFTGSYPGEKHLHTKSLIDVDVLIDDVPENFVGANRKMNILFTRPYNQHLNAFDVGLERAGNYQDVLEHLAFLETHHHA